MIVNESRTKREEEGVKNVSEGQESEDKKDKDKNTESEEKDNNDSESKNEKHLDEKVLDMDTWQLFRNVWDKVTKSYKETAQNLNDFVKNKLEYVASIRL